MTIEDLFFKLPLYQKIKLDNTHIELILNLFQNTKQVDGFNPDLSENSTFTINRVNLKSTMAVNFKHFRGYHLIDLICIRRKTVFTYLFMVEEVEIEEDEYEYFLLKVGQYPSIADLEFSKLEKYSKFISKNALHELKKSIGLAANGVGIGSYVYLRRVFENLIEEKHKDAATAELWNEKEYQNSKMDGKILLLKSTLPELLVKHRKVYSIISKGIHELSEQECLAYFEVLLDAICMILEEEFRLKQERLRLTKMEANLIKIQDKLKN